MASTASVNVPTTARNKKLLNEFHKQQITDSLWDQLSNRVRPGQSLPNGGPGTKIPKTVLMQVSYAASEGRISTIVPSLDKVGGDAVSGLQPLLGTGKTPRLRNFEVFYNLHRYAMKLKDGSVEGDMTEFYNIMAQKGNLFSDFGVEYKDLQYNVSLMEGADRKLTETEFWAGQVLPNAPVVKTLHPNIYLRTKSGKALDAFLALGTNVSANIPAHVNTAIGALPGAPSTAVTPAAFLAAQGWQSRAFQLAYAGYLETLAVGASGLDIASAKFDRLLLNAISTEAYRTLAPLGWSYAGKKVDYIVKISPMQAMQLEQDSSAQGWYDAVKAADQQMGEDSRILTGIFGVYRGLALLVDQRNPIVDFTGNVAATALDGTNNGFIKYWTPDSKTLARTTKTAAATQGSLECAQVLGRQTLAQVNVSDWSFTQEELDHGMSIEYGMNAKFGNRRVEFNYADETTLNSDGFVVSTKIPENWQSMLVLTATPAVTF